MITLHESSARVVRALASEVLLKVETRKAYADVLLDHILERSALLTRDRALLAEIVYGTLRWRAKIDHLLSPYLTTSLGRTDPFIRNLLRATIYQLTFLDKIPNYAAVNEAVAIAKQRGGPRLSGFVNAVLRGYLRNDGGVGKPPQTRDCFSELAIECSHPEWLVKKWTRDLGSSTARNLMQANNQRVPLVLRVNRSKTTRDSFLQLLSEHGIKAVPTLWSPQGVCVQGGSLIGKLPGFETGLFQVQGEASQLIAFLVGPAKGDRILDACAAPGGKTTHVAELLEDQGDVVALDLSEMGVERIRENCTRLGLRCVRTQRADITKALPVELRGPYDKILLDAPCSGLGTLRAHPEIKWHRNQKDVLRLSRLQKVLLERTAEHLMPNGVLVYSTCTLTKEENQHTVEKFLKERQDFVLESVENYLPESAKGLISDGYFVALPHLHGTDGFFAARLRKVRT